MYLLVWVFETGSLTMELLLDENTARVVDQAGFELREPPVSDPENGD